MSASPKRVLFALAALLACLLAGCREGAFLIYLFTPPPAPQTVPAKFDGLANRRVAIVLHCDMSVEYEYPGLRLELSTLLAAELRKRVEGVTVVDPRRVLQYQAENVRWDEMDRAKLSKEFGADYVLFVAMEEFTTREPGSVGLYRGRLAAEVSVYDAGLPEAQAWRGQDILVVYPLEGPVSPTLGDERQIRYETENLFADVLVKNFYKHKVPAK